MEPLKYDPAYVQIPKADAAEILGITVGELDQRRAADGRCPTGFRDWTTFPPATRFCLADIYAYSEAVMSQSHPAPVELLLNQSQEPQHL